MKPHFNTSQQLKLFSETIKYFYRKTSLTHTEIQEIFQLKYFHWKTSKKLNEGEREKGGGVCISLAAKKYRKFILESSEIRT